MVTQAEINAAYTLECPHCWSAKGEACVNRRGAPVERPHKARIEAGRAKTAATEEQDG